MAELIAILKAVTHEARQGETERNIHTNSLNSLHDLQRMIHSPHTMSTHEYRDILTFILKKATSKKDCEGQPLHVHLYKVKAHVNILGNEKADHFAKESYSTDSTAEHITLFKHHTSTHKQWLYDVKGKDPITIKEANSQIEASILKTAAEEVKYIEQWTQKDDSDPTNSRSITGRYRKRSTSSITKPPVASTTPAPGEPGNVYYSVEHADTLLTQHLKHRFKLQPSPRSAQCVK
jgi:ribonuclease HI